MKWFDRWFYRKAKHCWENKHEYEPEENLIRSSKLSTATADSDWGDGLNIRVNAALGGRIVSFHRYDRKTDRGHNTVYVIPDDHNFEEELGKLITLESMKL